MKLRAVFACLGMAGTLLYASPAAAAPYVSSNIQYGFPVGWVPEASAHANLGYSSMWAVGNNISGVDDALNAVAGTSVIPMINWYYWGGHISPSCVENVSNTGICGGRTRNLWTSKSQEMANTIASLRSNSTTVVVVEPEFQVAGNYEPLDDYMVAIANIFKAKPNIKIVSGFAEWANPTTYTTYEEIGAAAHYTGTQVLFSCIQQTQAQYLNAVERVIANATLEQQTYFSGKPVFVYDFGVSSYSGTLSNDPDYGTAPTPKDCKQPYTNQNYEEHQRTVMRAVFTEKARMKAQGVIAFVFREYYDQTNRPSWRVDYHLIAEKWWGIRRNYGGVNRAKLAWQDVIDGINAENGGSGNPSGYSPTLTVGANSSTWWIEVYASSDVTSVDVIGNNGAFYKNLPATAWGSFAASPPVPLLSGQPVRLIARRSSDGSSGATIDFPWLQEYTPATNTGWNASIVRAANCSTTWVELVVSSGATAVSVKAGTGPWTALTYNASWGKWVKAMNIAAGTKVVANATDGSGATAYSPIFTWMQ